MDAAYLARFLSDSEAESSRTGPPPGFPALPPVPSSRYTDPAFFEAELAQVFRKSWLYAAHESELAEVGAYKVCDVAGASVVIVRSADGVNAFLNACRHRGAPVVRDECGVARMLTCQFHSWTYDFAGSLVRVPDERDFVSLDRDTLGLTPVLCEAWGGWYFVKLDTSGSSESLNEFLQPVGSILESVASAKWRILDAKSVHIRCNWKVLAEGFLEVYHARTIHPTTVAPTLDTRGTVITLYNNGHSAMVSPVIKGTRTDGRDSMPMFPGAPPMIEASHNPAHSIFPNLITPLDGRGFPFLVFWPEAVDRTRLDIIWFVPDSGHDELPNRELWDKRLARFDLIMDEDYRNLEPIQRSLEHAAGNGFVLNYQERRIWHLHAWIDRVIGEANVAPPMRVADLLSEWVETGD
jgi:phenylpropionate dioxygenase-like ring-hydroxylating dioxygenase large terminal subunit